MNLIDRAPKLKNLNSKLEAGYNPSEAEMEDALSEIINTPLTTFLANAFEVPSELRALLVNRFDTVNDRNRAMFFLCFSKYMHDETNESHNPDHNTFMIYSDKFDSFLATAVLLTYVGK